MSHIFRPLIILGLAAVLVFAGCSDSGTSEGAAGVRQMAAAAAVEMIDTRTVIDVRTPAEYGAEHVAGAVNIDVEATDFGERIAELDPKTPYLLYCRSGRRSAIAADLMAAAGFEDVIDAGGLDRLAQAGAPIE